MNIVRLNTVSLDGIIKKGSGGGGVAINNQEKSLEITENGVTEVTADAGFTGLSKVVVNTNVQSGGNCNYKYYSSAAEDAIDSPDIYMFGICKCLTNDDERKVVLGPFVYTGGSPIAFAIDMNKKGILNNTEMSIRDFIADYYGVNLDSYVEISEEEFYHIPQDVHWDCTTEQGIKEIFENLYPIVQRYGVEYLQDSGIYLESWWHNVYITTAEGEHMYGAIYSVELGDNEAMEIVLTRITTTLKRPRLHISYNSNGSYSYYITES